MSEMKKNSIWPKVLGAGVAACLIGNLALGVYQIRSSSISDQKVSKFIDKELKRQAEESKKENEYQEDGYVISGEYEIRSTRAISDAYLSGDSSKLSKEDKETLEMATEIIEKITKDCKTAYEKEIAVYDWIYKNIRSGNSGSVSLPTDVSDDFTPYGVLKNKDAVCVGYATTFRLFMEMLEIECHIVHNEGHSWDLVKLDDEQWYHVDLYSDVANNSQYQNFNLSDATARNVMGYEWPSSALPSAEGIKYSYPVQQAEEIKDFYSIPKKIKTAIKKKKSGLYYRFKNKITEKEMELANVLVSNIQEVFYGPEYGGDIEITASWYDDGEGSYILGISFTYYGAQQNSGEQEKESKAAKKMKKAIEEAFDIDLDSLYDYEE